MLREPTGKFKVGVTRLDTKAIGDEPYKRFVPITIYYPCDNWDNEAPYLNQMYQKADPSSRESDVKTYVGLDAKLTSKIDRFPVVMHSHGLGGHEMESTVLLADLASNGYVILSVGHPYGATVVTYTNGERFINPIDATQMKSSLPKLEPLWYEDMRAAIDFMTSLNSSDSTSIWHNRLDMNTLGVIGVSYGGCCGVVAALKDSEFRYAVNLDGSMFVEPEYKYKDTPIYVMCSPLNIKARHTLLIHSLPNLKIQKIRNVSHFEFSDGVYLSNKGKSNREWADRISKERSKSILEFIEEVLN